MVKREFPKPEVKRVCHGLNTINWGRLLAGWLSSVGAFGNISTTLIDIDGVTRTGYIKHGRTSQYNLMWGTSHSLQAVELMVLCRLGTGTNSPTRTNTNLLSAVSGDILMSAVYNDGDYVTLTGTGNYSTSFSPSEIGLFIELGNTEYSGGKAMYMLDRAVFNPLPSGTTFTVRWDIPLG